MTTVHGKARNPDVLLLIASSKAWICTVNLPKVSIGPGMHCLTDKPLDFPLHGVIKRHTCNHHSTSKHLQPTPLRLGH